MKATHERVLEALAYDPETGVFTWLIQASSRALVGDVAGCPSNAYWRIKLDRQPYEAHVLAWFWVTGEWPTYEVDHIDGDGLNNRFANLRDEPRSVNQRNQVAPRRDNVSGYRGVYPHGPGWSAKIKADGRTRYLGTYLTPEEASAAYWAAKAEHHGAETYQVRLDREEK